MSDTLPEAQRAELVQEIREEFTFCYEGEQPQRQREDEDLRFQVPEMQWDEASKQARMGSTAGGVVVLPRPMLSISKIDQPHRLIMSQVGQARMGINIHPVSETANDETASVLQDLIRRIERDSNANVARSWAVSRASLAGRGAYQVVVRPDEDGFEYGDLEIGIERFLHQGCVYLDPSAQLPDYSDGDCSYVTSWLPLFKAARMFGASRAARAHTDGLAWANMKSEAPLWTKDNGSGVRSIQIAQRFRKKHIDEEILLVELPGGGVKGIRDGKDKIPRGGKVIDKRVRDRVEVWKYFTDGFEILEPPTKWLGKYIPIIPVLGRELHPFDEQRRIIGIVRNARDPQRLFNTSASVLMERMFMEPRAPWTGPEGFDEGREAQWARANIDNIPVLKYKPTLIPGTQTAAHAPMRTQMDTQGMSMALMSLQEAAVLCQDATAFFDPSLGKGAGGGQQESGRKVLALQGQGDAANSDWLQQLAVAMRYEALCIIDLIAPADKDRVGVYDAPGRITTVLGAEPSKARPVMLNREFIMDPRTGRPVPAPKGAPGAKHYDLKSGARYGVSIDIGTSFKTRLQEADESTTRIIEAWPEGLGIIGDLVFSNKDFPGSKEISERLEAMIRAQHPELFKEEEDSPEQAAMKVKALETKLQQLGQQLQQAAEFVKTEQAKHQAQIQIEQFKTTAQVEIEKAKAALQIELQGMKNAGALAVAEFNARAKGATITTEAMTQDAALTKEQEHETTEAMRDRLHETHEHREEMAHDVAMAAAGAHTTKRVVDQSREQGQEQENESSAGGSQSQENSDESGPPQPAGGAE